MKTSNYLLPRSLFSASLLLALTTIFFTPLVAESQAHKMILGRVVNKFSLEPVAYASVYWQRHGNGCVADSAGFFKIPRSNDTSDVLTVSFVGYDNVLFSSAALLKDTGLIIYMESSSKNEVVVTAKSNKGLRWWRNVAAHRKENSPGHYNNYHCELYNKIEIDIANVNSASFEKKKILKPFNFLLKNIDSTSENKRFLPVFLSETVSDYYVSHDPDKVREEIKAVHNSGIKNESIMQYMGGINQKINTYDDVINIFGKEFVSPVSAYGDKYYRYRGLDTQLINGVRYFHLLFAPKHEGDNLFSGDCWIQSTTWALREIHLFIYGVVNINFVKRLDIVQEFSVTDENKMFVQKDKFVIEIAPLGQHNPSFIGRKTSYYTNVNVNQIAVADKLNQNKKKEELIVLNQATMQSSKFWEGQRPDSLTKNELGALTLIDTLRSIPSFKKLTDAFTFIIDGHKKLGVVEIGPWYKWVSRNPLEGTRFRFDLGTTAVFSKNLRLYGYLAYGTRDGLWKGQIGGTYNLPGNTGWHIQSSYTNDLDNGRRSFSSKDGSLDNIFSQIIRRPGIRQKFIGKEETSLLVTKTFPMNFSVQASFCRSQYKTFDPLPPGKWFSRRTDNENTLISTELGVKLRYAPGEKTLLTHRKERVLKNNQPVMEVSYVLATPGILGSQYSYQKVAGSINQRLNIPRWGQLSYNLYAGKIFGDNIPFMMLEMHPGNELYYYNRNSFNLMNRYEFFSDRYAGITVEHNLEKKLLNLIPFMRSSRMRQFWNIKTVIGDLSPSNRSFNRLGYGDYGLKSLRGNLYTEIGTGFDNIFNFFRVDMVWRLAPSSMNMKSGQQFGVFCSFRLQF